MSGGAPAGIRLCGRGLAVSALARILAGEAIPVRLDGAMAPSPGAPVVMLGAQAVALLEQVLGRLPFVDAHPIRRRVVRWGNAAPQVMSHGALAVSGHDLSVAPAPAPTASPEPAATAFSVHAAPMPDAPALLRFGRRPAIAAPVALSEQADPHAALVEATAEGWLFLIPRGANRGWLLAVGGEPDALLGQSALVESAVSAVAPVEAQFETAPRILSTLVGPDWLALGHHALALDPICGDGTATAVRAAILAGAAIAELVAGRHDPAALLAHYQAMLIAALRRHCQVSLPFYQSGGTGPWWREQAEELARGHAWCTRQLARAGEPRFVLHGNRLVARAA